MMGLALLLATAAGSGSAAFDAPKVPDPVLAEQRGGFRLPSGIDVALTIQSQTAVDGAVVLRTTYAIDQGAPNLTVYAPENGRTVAAPQRAADSSVRAAGMPVISYSKNNGLQVIDGTPAMPILISGAPNDTSVPDGLRVIDTSQPVVTDNGVVTATANDRLRTVELSGLGLNVTHFAGDAIGSAIANSGNNRIIDTQTTASIDLRNAGPDVLGSTMLRVESLALDAVSSRL